MSNNRTPHFCFISPIPHLNDFASLSNKHLCLAHLVDTSNEYSSFYKKMRERGDYIIMDNSAFELGESFDPMKLLDLGEKCGANAIVLPDYPNQHVMKTINAAEKWAPIFRKNGFETMFVPQSEKGNWSEWEKGYQFADNHEYIDIIGMSILGIPNAMPYIPAAYARVVATHVLISKGLFSSKRHHYLGLNSGPALEIPPLLKMNALWSIDSSGPIWQGILGQRYTEESDSYQQVKKIHFPVDFNYNIKSNDKETFNRVYHNIKMTKELFNVN